MKTPPDVESHGKVSIADEVVIPAAKMFEQQLSELYSSEMLIRQAIRALSSRADDSHLQSEINNRIARLQTNLQAIEDVFTLLGRAPRVVISNGLKSMIRELSKSIDITDVTMRDVAIITALNTATAFTRCNADLLSCLSGKLGLTSAQLSFQTIVQEKTTEMMVLARQRAHILGCI